MRITVVGAGVIGLSCSVRLLEAGHRVDVLARELPLETTSGVAAAIWYPYLAEPRERVLAWGERAFQVFANIAATQPEAGVRMVPGTEVLRESAPSPWWTQVVIDFHRGGLLPHGYADGWTFTTPVIDMPTYLRWLSGRLESLGGTLTRLNLTALPSGADLVVNCTGLGARYLAADPSVAPVRGQVVRLAQFGLDRWWVDESGPTYVVPRERDVIVGGTEQRGEWDPQPDPVVAQEILERAARLVPEVAHARVLGHRVGLRPARPEVRLERQGDVVHCYGQGGSGVTLSWGCAAEVASLVD